MTIFHWIADWAPQIISILATMAALLTTGHIVLYKRETRSATGWIGLAWLVPLLGSALYLMFGINRIRRRAEELRADLTRYEFDDEIYRESLASAGEMVASQASHVGLVTADNPGRKLLPEGAAKDPVSEAVELSDAALVSAGGPGRDDAIPAGAPQGGELVHPCEPMQPIPAADIEEHLPEHATHMGPLVHVIDQIGRRPLLSSNHIEPLFNGEEAYPRMLEAIDQATTSVALATYIFDNDKWGRIFADALGRAVERGVKVRVLIDAAGLRYSFPSIIHVLRKKKVTVARFLPSIFPPHLMTVNLRNHRKILIVDGRIGFTGGMNIRSSHVLSEPTKQPTRDLHFELTGPVVAHLQEVFVDDWAFTTKEELRGCDWFPQPQPAGDIFARGIADGPDENIDKMPWTLLGAISAAKESIRIVTPYFLPESSLLDALNLAAMRGVRVDIIMPGENNLPYVQWASFGMMRPLLRYGCRAWLTPPPFEHSKVMVVDRFWFIFGSSNWDPRSHRLNFEFDVECYDATLAARLDDWALEKLDDAHQITLEEYDSRTFWQRLRDGTFRLFSPYL